MANLPIIINKSLPALAQTTRTLPQLFAALAGTPALLKALTTPFNHPGFWSDGESLLSKGHITPLKINSLLNRGYDMNLIQDEMFKDYEYLNAYNSFDDEYPYQMNDAASKTLSKYPYQEDLNNFSVFPSDDVSSGLRTVIDPLELREQISKQPNIKDWYRKVMSNTRNQPAAQSAINMLISNPDIGLRRR